MIYNCFVYSSFQIYWDDYRVPGHSQLLRLLKTSWQCSRHSSGRGRHAHWVPMAADGIASSSSRTHAKSSSVRTGEQVWSSHSLCPSMDTGCLLVTVWSLASAVLPTRVYPEWCLGWPERCRCLTAAWRKHEKTTYLSTWKAKNEAKCV